MAHQSDLIASDIETYLRQQESKELLRLITCGSVDDGKSTLIGRLLHDSKMIFEDHLAALESDSKKTGTQGEKLDFSLLVDGLHSEREQGITIDVAYRYFSTDKRKFIVADTPGHEQYTRNMATGASTADLAVILVDARQGILTQTRRHSLIVKLLGIKQVVLAVNKMDLVGYDQKRFETVCSAYRHLSGWLNFSETYSIPISALHGDNIVEKSTNMPWFEGQPLMKHLEKVPLQEKGSLNDFRFPVQYVNRPHSEFRGYCGTVASGLVAVGDVVTVLPSRKNSKIDRIVTYDGDLEQAERDQSVTLVLADDIDVGRGDLIAHQGKEPAMADKLEAMIVWMEEGLLKTGKTYDIKCASTILQGVVSAIEYRVDLNTQEHVAVNELALNDIGLCRLELTRAIPCDLYEKVPEMGSFILMDRFNHLTVGAGMIQNYVQKSENLRWMNDSSVDKLSRSKILGQKPFVLWLTGLSGAGKSTIAKCLEEELAQAGQLTYLLDGDHVRNGLCGDLGFSDADRKENIRRIGEVCKLFVDAGVIVISAFISPFAVDRLFVRQLLEDREFIEVHVDTPLLECEKRDSKGLYVQARSGKIKKFTGIDSPYEVPARPEIKLDGCEAVEMSVQQVMKLLKEGQWI